MKEHMTNTKAIVAFIMGILSLVFIIIFPLITFILAILGIVFGFLALSEIKKVEQAGRGMALAGIICSIIAFVLPIILMVLAFLMFAVNF